MASKRRAAFWTSNTVNNLRRTFHVMLVKKLSLVYSGLRIDQWPKLDADSLSLMKFRFLKRLKTFYRLIPHLTRHIRLTLKSSRKQFKSLKRRKFCWQSFSINWSLTSEPKVWNVWRRKQILLFRLLCFCLFEKDPKMSNRFWKFS